jgi:hypothetical protein
MEKESLQLKKIRKAVNAFNISLEKEGIKNGSLKIHKEKNKVFLTQNYNGNEFESGKGVRSMQRTLKIIASFHTNNKSSKAVNDIIKR